MKKVLLCVALFMNVMLVKAQESGSGTVQNPPIFIETFVGNRALAYQMIVDKKLQSLPKLGFFGVTNIQPEWGEPNINDFMIQGNLTYNIIKGIDLSGGFIWNPIDGIRPSAGAIFSYGNPKLLVILNPRIDISKNANFDLLGLIEYKPLLTEKINFYSRLQGVYTHNTGYDLHARSYVMLRAGITLKDITLGAAANFDWYGPMKINKNNFGGFFAINLL